jgi:hypothetical protein
MIPFRARNSLLFLFLATVCVVNASAQVSIWTHHNDNARTGANIAERTLNTSNVNITKFGKLFSLPVDGQVYAQPLYLPQVNISGKGVHNTLFVATMNDSVYAFDADSNSGANASPLWKVNFTNPAAGITPVPAGDLQAPGNYNVHGVVGILSTPVINQSTGTIYVLARTKENGQNFHRLHALDITSGAERPNSPVTIQASLPGKAYDAVGGVVSFNPLVANQRTALALSQGIVYIAWASLTDRDPFHGWVMGYDANTLRQVTVYNDTVDGGRGGIWQAGNGPAIDAAGSLYMLTGNGDWNGSTNLGSSAIKLSPNPLTATDYFTPSDWQYQNDLDLDLGSSGPLLLPGTNLVIGGGKEGIMYVMSTYAMGHLQSNPTSQVQAFQAAIGHIHGAPVYWQSPNLGPLIYVWGERTPLRAFHFNSNNAFDTAPIMQSTFSAPPGMPGAMLSVSANGSQSGTGIVWAALPVDSDAVAADVPGVLRAFDASDLTHELWNSLQNKTRDDLGLFGKFVPPSVANGRVYLATFSNQICVYGLFNSNPDFSISSSTAGTAVQPGGSAKVTINVQTANGLSTPVALSAGGLPAGATASFAPSSVTGNSSSQLTITAGGATPVGNYTVTVNGTSGNLAHSLTFKLFVNTSAGSSALSVTQPTTTQDLTQMGRTDWIKWGVDAAPGMNRKAGVAATLSDFQLIGTAPVNSYGNNPFGFSWSDGTPTATATGSTTGVYVVGQGNGFTITAPADTTPRTLTVYAGVYKAGASVAVSLSDFSAPQLVNTSVINNAGQLSVAYTLTYQAGSPGQTLTFSIVQNTPPSDPWSNVTLQAATLSTNTSSAPDLSLSVAPQPISVPVGAIASTTVSVVPSGGFSETVTLSAQWVPPNTAAIFSPTTLTKGTATLTFATNSGATPGTYLVKVFATSASLQRMVYVTLNITPSLSGTGSISGATSFPTATQDLTAVGSADWIQWGLGVPANINRKGGVTAQLSTFTPVGNATVTSYSNNPFGFYWSDGGTIPYMLKATSGVYVIGQGNGFTITAPADPGVRTLVIYIGVYKSQAKLTATLSDGSAPQYVDTSMLNMNGLQSGAYTLTYKAGSAGQKLSVTITQLSANTDAYSNVTLQAAALSGPAAATQGSLSAVVSIPTVNENLTALGSSDWVQWNSGGQGTLVRKSSGGSQISNYTVLGTAAAQAYNNNPFGFSWTDGTPTTAASGVSTGAYTVGMGTGFQLSFPADTNWRTVTIHAGVYKSAGRITASLSDGSAPNYTDNSIVSQTGSLSAAYTIRYRAANPNARLTVTYKQDNPGYDAFANVTLQAASLANQ